MSAHPGTIEACEVYQELKAEYEYEMRSEMVADFEHDKRKDGRLEGD